MPPGNHFNPRSPCGERLSAATAIKSMCKFQSTLPVWGATPMAWMLVRRTRFQSTLPVWGATDFAKWFSDAGSISIHAPRVGSDHGHDTGKLAIKNFNPRSPCGERPGIIVKLSKFRSHFNPRSPCGERQIQTRSKSNLQTFQSTLPVWGATSGSVVPDSSLLFQSTLPVWGATGTCQYQLSAWRISIHAPRVGSDPSRVTGFRKPL